MKTCPEEIVLFMQEYLDGDLSHANEQVLKEHLQKCEDCQTHFQELKRTAAFIKGSSNIKVSDGFTAGVMARLPKEKSSMGARRWLRRHPLLSAASLFLFLMAGSLFSIWNDDQKFAFTKQPDLVVENDTVIVPEGKVVEGDLVVKNGNLRILGEVNGNVTVINGDKYLASAGNVTGDIEEIDKAFDWIWYKIKTAGKSLMKKINE